MLTHDQVDAARRRTAATPNTNTTSNNQDDNKRHTHNPYLPSIPYTPNSPPTAFGAISTLSTDAADAAGLPPSAGGFPPALLGGGGGQRGGANPHRPASQPRGPRGGGGVAPGGFGSNMAGLDAYAGGMAPGALGGFGHMAGAYPDHFGGGALGPDFSAGGFRGGAGPPRLSPAAFSMGRVGWPGGAPPHMGGMPGVNHRLMHGGRNRGGGRPYTSEQQSRPPAGAPSRALYVNKLPPDVTYEELCSAVGAFGSLELVKIYPERRHAFINFVSVADAYNLMIATGGHIVIRDNTLMLQWGKARPVPHELLDAIRAGATRSLYVANVSDAVSEQDLYELFGAFGELESVRALPRRFAAFANFTSVISAIKARAVLHGKPVPPNLAQMGDTGEKSLMINFTSAVQNCIRARHGIAPHGYPPAAGFERPPGYGGGGGERGRGLGGGGGGGYPPNYRYRGMPMRGPSTLPKLSRGLYFGSLPDTVELSDLAAQVERYGIVESLRLMRQKSCAFINFSDEATAKVIVDAFGARSSKSIEIDGKQLTVNYAKVRPCKEEQLAKFASGVRRKLLVKHAAGTTLSAEAIIAATGAQTANTLLGVASVDALEEGSGEHAVTRLEFISVAAAEAAKAALETEEKADENEGEAEVVATTLKVLGVEYLVEPVEAPPPPPSATEDGDVAKVAAGFESLAMSSGAESAAGGDGEVAPAPELAPDSE